MQFGHSEQNVQMLVKMEQGKRKEEEREERKKRDGKANGGLSRPQEDHRGHQRAVEIFRAPTVLYERD